MLDNSFCNHELDNIHCCFDAGDCFHDRFLCTTCSADMSWFRDSVCDSGLNTLECCFDGGDCPCPTCAQTLPISGRSHRPGAAWYSIALGNLQCDRLLDTPECCFDSFDCLITSNRICPTCTKPNGIIHFMLGDGVCQPELFYDMGCCFDAGDCDDGAINLSCSTCRHPKVDWLGDGYCDKDLYSEGIQCCWDLGDCRHCLPRVLWKTGPLVVSGCMDDIFEAEIVKPHEWAINCYECPSLSDRKQCQLLGDGKCHKELMNANSCFDMEDCWCPLCQDKNWYARVGDGICNAELLSEACCFDNGDCSHQNNYNSSAIICPTCGQESSKALIFNGECDGFLLNEACCFDGGDCGCPTCSLDQEEIGNGLCHRPADTLDCCYDGGDCRCQEVTMVTNKCCPESESAWCLPPNSLCPTCSFHLSAYLRNGQCDPIISWDKDCCFDEKDCTSNAGRYVFMNNKRYITHESWLPSIIQ